MTQSQTLRHTNATVTKYEKQTSQINNPDLKMHLGEIISAEEGENIY